MRRVLLGTAAVVVALGWLQLAPAFGFPVTAPAAMLDRMLGAHREAGPAGWALLLLGMAAFAAAYFLVVEPRTQKTNGMLAAFAYAVAAWLISGAVLMPVIALIQGAPPAGDTANDPMRATFFMLNLGLLAAVESLVGWLLFGAVLAAGRHLDVRPRVFYMSAGAVVVAAALAFALPFLVAKTNGNRVVGGNVVLPSPGPVFISVLELPQPAGAVLGPHKHIPGFVLDVSGTATMAITGKGTVDVNPGEAVFTANLQPHDHENRAAVPIAIVLAALLVVLAVALLAGVWRRRMAVLLAALLALGVVATIDPLMNHWYFVGVRPAAARGAVMPVPAGQRTFESENLTGLAAGPYVERLTYRWLASGESVAVTGPAAIVVLDGQGSVASEGKTTDLSAGSGATIAGGADASIKAGSQGARILVVQLLPGA
jgi:quercetin dioxygenase-like cupin family protein